VAKSSRFAAGKAAESVAAGAVLTLIGVASGSTKGPAEFMLYSFDVKFDGQNVCRLGDPLFHNRKNTLG
jgi:hypothetical protein